MSLLSLPKRKRLSRRPEVETLEDRSVPAIIANGLQLLTGQTTELVITADTTTSNRIVVTRGSKVALAPTGGLINVPSIDVFHNNLRLMQFESQRVASLRFNGSTGPDTFFNASNLTSFLNGGGGNDSLVGGTSSDTLQGSNGNDTLDGGTGQDTVFEVADADFTLTDLTGVAGTSTLFSHHSGQDTLRRIGVVNLNGGPSGNKFFTSTYKGTVIIDGAGGDDHFVMGPGVESVTGGPGNDTVQMFVQSILSYQKLSDSEAFVGQGIGIDNMIGIERAILDGSEADNQIDLNGFSGTAIIKGNGGNDILRGSDGNDSLFGGAGNDIMLESGGTDLLDGGIGDNPVFGLVNRRLTPSELNSGGTDIAVVLRKRIDPQTQAQIPVLEVAGPSGAGFALEGNWTRGFEGDNEVFTATNEVTLKSALGDIRVRIPSFAPLKFVTKRDFVDNFGILEDQSVAGFTKKAVSWNSGPSLNTADPNSPLHIIKDTIGLDFQVPGAEWGVALGSQLGHLDAPLNPAVPYIFFTVNTDFSASFGDLSVSASLGAPNLTVVFDPSDAFLYVKSNLPIPFEVGYSDKGYIPFRPDLELDGNPEIYGNFAAEVSVPLGVVPVNINGGFVLDLDANDDGQRLGFTADNLARLARGDINYGEFVLGGINDVAFGVNGDFTLNYSKANFGFELDTFSSTAAFTPGTSGEPAAFAFHAAMTNPFTGTPLEVFNVGTFDGRGTIKSNGDLDVTLTGGLGGLLGTVVQNQASINLTNNGVTVDAFVKDVLGFTEVELHGSVLFDGSFILTGDGDAGVELKLPFTDILLLRANLHADATLSRPANGAVTFGANLLIDPLDIGPIEILNFRGSLSGNLTAGPGGFSASGSVEGDVNNIPFVGTEHINVGWALTNGVVSVNLADGLAFSFNFNTAPAFEERTITEVARAGGVVTLSGVITEVDPLDEFILDVDWGDGTTETFTFPEGSDGDRVSVTHRYAEASPEGQPYVVTATWRDPAGASNSALLETLILPALPVPMTPMPTLRPSLGLSLADLKQRFRNAEVRGADVNGDGVLDAVVLEKGRRPRVRVIDGRNGVELFSFDPRTLRVKKNGPTPIPGGDGVRALVRLLAGGKRRVSLFAADGRGLGSVVV